MAVKVKTCTFEPVGKCVAISNGDIEAIVSVDVGPRIISLRAFDGENIMYVDREKEFFNEDPSIIKNYGKKRYYFLGGHRLWTTPEVFPETYYPDDEPVAWEKTEQGAIFTPNPFPYGLQHKTEIRMADKGAELEVIHTVTNVGTTSKKFALWGITQMEKGGIGVAPQNDRQCSPLANRLFVHWPYNDLNDARFHTSMKYITLRQDVYGDGSFKYGINSEKGWAGYIRKGQMFIKHFEKTPAESIKSLPWPDYGCNFESYTDRRALEVESLTKVYTVKPGESKEMTESWCVLQLPGEVPEVHTPEFDAFIDSLDIK